MINGYDFDGTIYDGDSSVDFYFYCLKKNKTILLCLPIQLYGLLLYILGIKDKTFFKEKFFSFLKKINNVDDYIKDFWKDKIKNIKSWYLEQKKPSDIIISASPEFLLKPLEKILKIKVIATKVDKNTGKFNSLNCHDYEKIKRYEQETKKKNNINKFYSDSIKADRPLLEYAKEAYLVRKNKIEKINLENIKEEKSNGLLIGINIFSFLCFLFIFPTMMFFLNININKFYFPLAILFSIILPFFMTNKNPKKTLIISSISIFLICFSVVFSIKIIDTSVDGNSYRKITSGLMIEGWNPIKESAKSFNKREKILPNKLSKFGNRSQWFWMDVYPKGLATFGATIEKFTGKIESGKCYTLLTMIVIFFVYNHYLKYFLKKNQSTILSFILAINPVSLCQLRTFYVDAALSNIVLIALGFILLYFKENNKEKKWYIPLIALSIIYIFNIKFNEVLYIGIITLSMWLIVLINNIKNKNYKESKYIFVTFVLSIIISIFLGFSPYISNIYRYHEFLPGITGDSTSATGAITASTANKSSLEIFYINIFSKVGDYWSDKNLPLKIPFTISKEEIENYYIHAGQFGTFGALFGGLFILMIAIGLYLIIKYHKLLLNNKNSKYMLIMAILIYLQCSLSPIGFGGLRYVAHFYILFIYVIGLALYFINKTKSKTKIIANISIYTIILISILNVIPYFNIFKNELYQEKNSRSTLYEISQNKKNLQIGLSVLSSHGILLNLRENNIKYGEYEFIEDGDMGEDYLQTLSYQVKYKYKNDDKVKME